MVKQVIVMRRDLKCRRGKEIAQACHASISFLTKKLNDNIALNDMEKEWIQGKFTKICLQVNSEKELDDVYDNAKRAGLEVHLIIDSGKTEFNNVPTKTCLAIGPNRDEDIDKITGHLKLY